LDHKALMDLIKSAYKDNIYMQYQYGVYLESCARKIRMERHTQQCTIGAFKAYQSEEKNHKLQFMKNISKTVKTISKAVSSIELDQN
ncbi:590_t:CDS:2, partial [Gigaspora margarita]